MKRQIVTAAAVAFLFWGSCGPARADDAADLVKKQKATALEHWKQLFGDDQPAQEETDHLLLFAAPTFSAQQVLALGNTLEKVLALSVKAVRLDPKDELWSGKMAVFVLDDRGQFNSFVRRVAKRRTEADELGLFSIRGETPYVGAGPGTSTLAPPPDVQAEEQLAAAVLNRKGAGNLPQWVLDGFGGATAWRAAPKGAWTMKQRQLARLLVARQGRTAKDIWSGNLEGDEAQVLGASFLDFLAYGPGASLFPKFLEGFAPDEDGGKKKTAAQAIQAMKLDPARLDQTWRVWVARGQY